MSDVTTRYRPVTRILHWAVALIVIATIPVGQLMIQDGLSRTLQNTLFIFHKNVGVLILLLVIVRLAYRAIYPAPPFPSTMPAIQRRIAPITHWLLYGLLLVMALSGYIRVEAGNFPIEMLDALGVPALVPVNETLENTAKAVHFYARFVLVPLIFLHIGAGLYHRFVLRDGIFGRIWPLLGR